MTAMRKGSLMKSIPKPGFSHLRPQRPGRVDLSPEDRRDVLNQLFFSGERRRPYLFRFTTLLSLSVAIATFGLIANSTAVVIGAMLVAPLMTPIQASAAAVVMGWTRRQLNTLAFVLLAAGWAVALSFSLALITPDQAVLPSEVLARTNPTLLDLFVALAAGAAGAYTLVRRESSALPGVAVAVALVPPLSVVGITLEANQNDLALNALLLFTTNLVAIVLAASLVLIITGFTPTSLRERNRTQIRRGFIVSAIAVVIIAIPLGYHSQRIVSDARERHEVEQAVKNWIGTDYRSFDVLSVDIDGHTVWVDIIGPSEPPVVQILNNSISERLGDDVTVHVRWVQRNEILLR
jgi:uncharacterized hydrophobic protein (TIGR00271 family)